MSFLCSASWTWYGYLIEDRFVSVPNFLACLVSTVQVALFVIFPRVTERKEKEGIEGKDGTKLKEFV